MSKYKYGLIFWNDETDEEISVYFEAGSYFDAERILEKENWSKEGFIHGTLHFIEDQSLTKTEYKPIQEL